MLRARPFFTLAPFFGFHDPKNARRSCTARHPANEKATRASTNGLDTVVPRLKRVCDQNFFWKSTGAIRV
jgi:hypothetical protein